MAIKTHGIDHIHLNVRDMDQFRRLMKALFEIDASRFMHIDSIHAFNAVVRVAPADAGQPFLDVFEPARANSPVARHIETHGQGVSYISFRVDNIEEAAKHAAACGLREVSRVGFPGVEKQVQFDTKDLVGFNLEFVEWEPGHEQAIAEIQRRLAAGERVEGISFSEPF